MLRRDTLLVGRVNGEGVFVWGRGSVNEKIKELYKRMPGMFHVYKNKIYLMPSTENSDIILDALGDSVAVVIGSGPLDSLDGVECSIRSFKNYIKNNTVCVGEVRDGEVLWIEDTWALGISQKTMIEQWSRDTSFFEVLDNKVYYIKPKQEIVEALYYECVEIAGSELRLAKALARGLKADGKMTSYRKEKVRNIAALRRFSFKHRENFARYVGLFTQYLKDHEMPTDGLFSPSLAKG